MGRFLWQAEPERAAAASITRFTREVAATGREVAAYPDLHRWSVECPEEFWPLAWDFCGLVGTRGGTAVERAEDPLGWRFFPGAKLNVVETLLNHADDRAALVAVSEAGDRTVLTRAELKVEVARLAAALRAAGVGRGDHVAGFLPNAAGAVTCMLATAWVGAVWSSCSPEFGADVVVDRFGQIAPKVLFGVTGYRYGGKDYNVAPVLSEIARRIPSLAHVVTLDRAEAPDGMVAYAAFLGAGAEPGAPEPLGFSDPLYVLFSSGTTGRPKCIEHAGGGALLRQMVEHQLHADLRPGDVMFYYSTTSWMMWNWLVAGLASEAVIVLYDGNPMHPGQDRLFDLAAAEQITHFGVSAKYIDATAKAGLKPAASHDLSALRVVWSTGSPLSTAGSEHVYADWKPDVQLSSICGGTDILGAFIGGAPTLPVHAGEIPGPTLGLDAAVVDEAGQEVLDAPGELVCRQPHPSMPTRFLNDPGKARYRASYYDRFPAFWRQGDFAIRRATGGFEVLGRSDATLNPGGVRIGTAEIYRQTDAIPGIADAVVVGQSHDNDVRVVLFVVPAEGARLDDALRSEIRARIRQHASPRHVPAVILDVPEIPRTRSGKIAELAVRDAVNNQPVRDLGGLANPQSLDAFRNRPELAA
ncbi:acetoacetate--CoA ligase [Defluviimonas salinarum]|uniref:Acetoacetate--CoA ligase n=1 Tax=Defluviimonas salinarum TaxID=2992147 RepID=A0ABT3JAX7_9RHOB|nr:acetoacetate--CoA ligase [Defluviimonas salinarum]MCW3784698.1 acetoacetate--CoA ligase [Defluviimonas salinarum]